MFVGRWRVDGGGYIFDAEIRSDRTMHTSFGGLEWAVHDGKLYVDSEPDATSSWQRVWTRLIGAAPHGVPSDFEIISENEISLDGSGAEPGSVMHRARVSDP